jgi:hypothetical protein
LKPEGFAGAGGPQVGCVFLVKDDMVRGKKLLLAGWAIGIVILVSSAGGCGSTGTVARGQRDLPDQFFATTAARKP